MDSVERTATRIKGFESGELDFQLMRLMGACTAGGGSPGEIMAARARMGSEDPRDWPGTFGARADALVALADAAEKKGHYVSARDHLLAASSYYRSAEYFADPFGDEVLRLGKASGATFQRAAPHLPAVVEPVEIPYEGVMLPGYLVRPDDSGRPNKTLIALTGFDGTAEELWFQTARDGVARGWTVLIAQGPGQVGTQRTNPELIFRPDYEVAISAIVDFALGQDCVDADRLGLYGISFGGYFVTRGTAHEPRVKAVIANAPIVDMHAYMSGFLSGSSGVPEDTEDLRLEDVDSVPDAYMRAASKISFKQLCQRFGVKSMSEWLKVLEGFRVDRLQDVRCPALGLAGEGEGAETLRQAKLFAESVSGPATTRTFTVAEGADMHCQVGNLPLSNAVVYDWLDEVIGGS